MENDIVENVEATTDVNASTSYQSDNYCPSQQKILNEAESHINDQHKSHTSTDYASNAPNSPKKKSSIEAHKQVINMENYIVENVEATTDANASTSYQSNDCCSSQQKIWNETINDQQKSPTSTYYISNSLFTPTKMSSIESEELTSKIIGKSPKSRTPGKHKKHTPSKCLKNTTKRLFRTPSKSVLKRHRSFDAVLDESSIKSHLVHNNNDEVSCLGDNDDINDALEQKATKVKMTAKNVKSMIHHVLKNEHVLNMFRDALEAEHEAIPEESSPMKMGDSSDKLDSLPKMTRAKVKEYLEKISMPSPAKSIKDGPSILDVEFNEEEDDDEYNPEKDEECHESDDESFTSSKLSEFGSPYRDVTSTPIMTPSGDGIIFGDVNRELNSYMVSMTSATNLDVLTIDTDINEVDTIALRTRSKLPLTSTSITEIESAFVAPDITTDMYDNICDDADWVQFLSSLYKPADDTVTDDDTDANDPEFNYIAEAEREQLDEEDFRFDKPTQITKKEMTALINELNDLFEDEVLPYQVVAGASGMTGSKIMQSDDQDMPSSSTSVPYIETLHSMPTLSEAPFTEFKTPQPVPPLGHIKCNNLEPPRQLLQQPLEQPCQMAESYISSVSEPDIIVTPEQRALIEDNLRQNSPSHAQEAAEAKSMLEELNGLRLSSHAGESSLFNVCNLDPAMELLSDPTLSESNETERSSGFGWNHGAEPRCMLSHAQKMAIYNSPAFVYPHLLPPLKKLKSNERKYSKFSRSEDNLIALGLEKYQQCKNANPIELIHRNLIRDKSVEQIFFRIQYMSSGKVGDNPIKCVKKTGKLPADFPRPTLENFYPMAPKDQMQELLPSWCSSLKHSRTITSLSKRVVQPGSSSVRTSQSKAKTNLIPLAPISQLPHQDYQETNDMSIQIPQEDEGHIQQTVLPQIQPPMNISQVPQSFILQNPPAIQLPSDLPQITGIYIQFAPPLSSRPLTTTVAQVPPLPVQMPLAVSGHISRSSNVHYSKSIKRKASSSSGISAPKRKTSALTDWKAVSVSTQTNGCASPDLLAKTMLSCGIEESALCPSPHLYNHDLDMSYSSSTPVDQDKHPSVRNLNWEFEAAQIPIQPLCSTLTTEAETTTTVHSQTLPKPPSITSSMFTRSEAPVPEHRTTTTPFVSLDESDSTGKLLTEQTAGIKVLKENHILNTNPSTISNPDILKQVVSSQNENIGSNHNLNSQSEVLFDSVGPMDSEILKTDTRMQSSPTACHSITEHEFVRLPHNNTNEFSSHSNILMDFTAQSDIVSIDAAITINSEALNAEKLKSSESTNEQRTVQEHELNKKHQHSNDWLPHRHLLMGVASQSDISFDAALPLNLETMTADIDHATLNMNKEKQPLPSAGQRNVEEIEIMISQSDISLDAPLPKSSEIQKADIEKQALPSSGQRNTEEFELTKKFQQSNELQSHNHLLIDIISQSNISLDAPLPKSSEMQKTDTEKQTLPSSSQTNVEEIEIMTSQSDISLDAPLPKSSEMQKADTEKQTLLSSSQTNVEEIEIMTSQSDISLDAPLPKSSEMQKADTEKQTLPSSSQTNVEEIEIMTSQSDISLDAPLPKSSEMQKADTEKQTLPSSSQTNVEEIEIMTSQSDISLDAPLPKSSEMQKADTEKQTQPSSSQTNVEEIEIMTSQSDISLDAPLPKSSEMQKADTEKQTLPSSSQTNVEEIEIMTSQSDISLDAPLPKSSEMQKTDTEKQTLPSSSQTNVEEIEIMTSQSDISLDAPLPKSSEMQKADTEKQTLPSSSQTNVEEIEIMTSQSDISLDAPLPKSSEMQKTDTEKQTLPSSSQTNVEEIEIMTSQSDISLDAPLPKSSEMQKADTEKQTLPSSSQTNVEEIEIMTSQSDISLDAPLPKSSEMQKAHTNLQTLPFSDQRNTEELERIRKRQHSSDLPSDNHLRIDASSQPQSHTSTSEDTEIVIGVGEFVSGCGDQKGNETSETVLDIQPAKSDEHSLPQQYDKLQVDFCTKIESKADEESSCPLLTNISSDSEDITLTCISASLESLQDSTDLGTLTKPKTVRQILEASRRKKTHRDQGSSAVNSLTSRLDVCLVNVNRMNLHTGSIKPFIDNTKAYTAGHDRTLLTESSGQQTDKSPPQANTMVASPVNTVALFTLHSPAKSHESTTNSSWASPFKTPTKLRPLVAKALSPASSSSSPYVPLPKVSPKRKELNRHVRQILPKSFVFEIKSPSPTKTAAQVLKRKATMYCQNRSPVKLLPKQPQSASSGVPRSRPLLTPTRMFTRSQKTKGKNIGNKARQEIACPTGKDIPPDKEKEGAESEMSEAEDAVLSQEEEEEEFEDEDQLQLDDLMAACTTIGYDPKKGNIGMDSENKSKAQKKRDICLSTLEPDIIDRDPKKDERDTAYAQHYFTLVKQMLIDDPERFKKFLTILHEMNKNHMDPIELYADMATLLSGHQDLVEDFAGFMLSFQAVECNCFVSYLEYQQILTFLRKLEIYCDTSNLTYQRTLKMMSRWLTLLNQEAQVDTAAFKERITAVLRHVPNVMDDLQFYFFGTHLVDSHPDDFEEVDLLEDDGGDVDEFEEITLPESREDYNTKLCSCQCHQDQQDEKLRRRIKHCFSCSLKIFDGKPVLKTSRNEYRPITVLYPLEEKEKMMKAKKEAAQLALAKARAQRQQNKKNGKKRNVGNLKCKNPKNMPMKRKFKRRKRYKTQSSLAQAGDISNVNNKTDHKQSDVKEGLDTVSHNQEKLDSKNTSRRLWEDQHEQWGGTLTESSTQITVASVICKSSSSLEDNTGQSSLHLIVDAVTDKGVVTNARVSTETVTLSALKSTLGSESPPSRNVGLVKSGEESLSLSTAEPTVSQTNSLATAVVPLSHISTHKTNLNRTTKSLRNKVLQSQNATPVPCRLKPRFPTTPMVAPIRIPVIVTISPQQYLPSAPAITKVKTHKPGLKSQQASPLTTSTSQPQLICSAKSTSYKPESCNQQQQLGSGFCVVSSVTSKAMPSSSEDIETCKMTKVGNCPTKVTADSTTGTKVSSSSVISLTDVPCKFSTSYNSAIDANLSYDTRLSCALDLQQSDTRLSSALDLQQSDTRLSCALDLQQSDTRLSSALDLQQSYTRLSCALDLQQSDTRLSSALDLQQSDTRLSSALDLQQSDTRLSSALDLQQSDTRLSSALDLQQSDTTFNFPTTPLKHKVPASVIRAHVDNFSLGAYEGSLGFHQLQQFALSVSPNKLLADSMNKFDLLALLESSRSCKDLTPQSGSAGSDQEITSRPLLTFSGALAKLTATSEKLALTSLDAVNVSQRMSTHDKIEHLPAASGGSEAQDQVNFDYATDDESNADPIQGKEEELLKDICPQLNSSNDFLNDESSNAFELSIWTEEQDRTILNVVTVGGMTSSAVQKIHSEIKEKSTEEIISRARLLLRMLEDMGDTESDTGTEASHGDQSEQEI